jgi:hypothetical protein
MGLGDCTVGVCGFYTDPVSPSTLFDFLQEIWRTGDIQCFNFLARVNLRFLAFTMQHYD